MLEVHYPLRDDATGQAGELRLRGGVWAGDVCGFEFVDTLLGLAGTVACDWREAAPRLWLDEGDGRAPAATARLAELARWLRPFHAGAFRHLTDRDVRRGSAVPGTPVPAAVSPAPASPPWPQLAAALWRDGAPRLVLDLGSPHGQLVRHLRQHGVEAYGYDLCPDPGARPDPDLGLARDGPLAEIPFGPADGFDTLLACDVLARVPEHLLGDLVAELARLGAERLVVQIPTAAFHEPGQVTLRPPSWWDRRLTPWFRRVPSADGRRAAALAAGLAPPLRVYEPTSVPAAV
ncbi:MAG: hypothetical protein KF830_00060 [Planctomycetes bacterium]|nr:hypothetical protein [Planctomycetota bacterium]